MSLVSEWNRKIVPSGSFQVMEEPYVPWLEQVLPGVFISIPFTPQKAPSSAVFLYGHQTEGLALQYFKGAMLKGNSALFFLIRNTSVDTFGTVKQ